MILTCSCDHAAQDRIHGQGRRVHNFTKDGSGGIMWRCTVCEKEQAGKNETASGPKKHKKGKEYVGGVAQW